jgi:thiamine-monophosphate kinase
LDGFSRGLFELADRYRVALVGGDTVKGPLAITIQIAGEVEAERWLTRSGAQPGDLLYVSGTPGDAAAGLAVLQNGTPATPSTAQLQQRFLRPQPRVELGRALREIATSAMDISDGLLTDLDKLCAASRCGARVDVDALPLSAALRASFSREQCRDFALAGGDDYELLFTIPPHRVNYLPTDVACTRIGVMTQGGVECRQAGQLFTPTRRGYDHFALTGSDA